MNLSISRDGVEIGEWTEEQARAFYKEGQLVPTDLYWKEGMSEWKEFGTLIKPPPPSAPLSAPTATKHKSAVSLPGISRDSLGSYARSNLQVTETPLFKTTLHWVIFLQAGFLVFLSIGTIASGVPIIGFILIITLLLILPFAIINYICSEFVVTDQRVLLKMGFIRRRTLEMFISKIESIGIDQDIFGRLLGYGTVTVRGTGGSMEKFPMIGHALAFRASIQNIQTQLESK